MFLFKWLRVFAEYLAKFPGETLQKFADFLREFSRSFSAKSHGEINGLREHPRNLAEFSPRKFAFENFCSWSEREKRAFFLGWSVTVFSENQHKKTNCFLSRHFIINLDMYKTLSCFSTRSRKLYFILVYLTFILGYRIFYFFLIWALRPIKIISLILSKSVSRWGKNRRSRRKTTWSPTSRTWLVSHVHWARLETHGCEMTSDLER